MTILYSGWERALQQASYRRKDRLSQCEQCIVLIKAEGDAPYLLMSSGISFWSSVKSLFKSWCVSQ